MKVISASLAAMAVFCLGCEKNKPQEPTGGESNRLCSVGSAKDDVSISKDVPLSEEKVAKAIAKISEWSADIKRFYSEGTTEQIDILVSQLKEVLLPVECRLREGLLFPIEYAAHDIRFDQLLTKEKLPPSDLSIRFKNFCHLSEELSSLAFLLTGDAVHSAHYDLVRCQNIKSFIILGRWNKMDELVALGEAKLDEWLEKYYDAEDCHLKIAMERWRGDGHGDPPGDVPKMRIWLLKSFFRTVRTRPPKWYVGKEFADW